MPTSDVHAGVHISINDEETIVTNFRPLHDWAHSPTSSTAPTGSTAPTSSTAPTGSTLPGVSNAHSQKFSLTHHSASHATSRRLRRAGLSVLATGTLVATTLLPAGTPAFADPASEDNLVIIPQSQMTVVHATESDPNEPGGGKPELALDGDPETYWHTRWSGGNPPKIQDDPHVFMVKLADAPVKLARLVYTPRQSSYGSGRAHEWQLLTTSDPTCDPSTLTPATAGSWDGRYADGAFAQDRIIEVSPSVEATCAALVFTSAWGGLNPEDPVFSKADPAGVSSMAELKAYRERTADEAPAPPTPPVTPPAEDPVTVPAEDLVTLSDGDLSVAMHKTFPQVYSWTKSGVTAFGHRAAPTPRLVINERPYAVTPSDAQVSADGKSASWTLAVEGTKVQMTARALLADGAWIFELADLVDPDGVVKRVQLDGFNLVTFPASDESAQFARSVISVDRASSGDRFTPASSLPEGEFRVSHLVVPSSKDIAFGVDSNGVEDNTAGLDMHAVLLDNSRWLTTKRKVGNVTVGALDPGTFTWRGASATVIGLDENPRITVKPTLDANGDATIDWQDGAIAMRDIRPAINGQDQVKDTVVTRIPFNIVSQATHPFLRTLDDTKRIALATDHLRQQVMLKGYEAEGHDSAHPDYGGHYNTRAGGLKDLTTLVNEAEQWNALIGVHVNATESYSEAHNFSEDLLRQPITPGWGWMNQAYMIDGPKDLGTGAILERFKQFRSEVPKNLNWLYIDVYYPNGWEPARLGKELEKQGWVVGTEWADKHINTSIWSHWANDEKYGGQNNKGVNSQIFRFVENHRRDIFNPHPILSNSRLIDFEGWTGQTNFNEFIRNVWQRNLPTKFLQQSPIMKWDATTIHFANGTVASSPLESISGDEVPTNRTITFDGQTVYQEGRYLLPWRDGGAPRLYHWNPAGGASEWTLTDAWKAQASLALFELRDQGRVKVADLPVVGGKVTIPDVKSGVAYVLYPSSSVPEPKAPQWGQGSMIADPGFFSGTLDAYQTAGKVSVERSDRGNLRAVLGEGPAALAQSLNAGDLPAGTYSVSAWVEIEPGKERPVALSVVGANVKLAGTQGVSDGVPTSVISSSTAVNATASDQLHRTYFQRVRVTFSTTGGSADVIVAAGEGDALVRVDDLRVVSFTPSALPEGVDPASVIAAEDFEHTDAGYWPFVTGKDNIGGDARTQLAERHEPYSQAGWYAKEGGSARAGAKLSDNVLNGQWSLMSNEENEGLILRTTQASVPFVAGRDYKIAFKYQNAVEGAYRFVTGVDSVANGAVSQSRLGEVAFALTSDASVSPVKATTASFEHVLSVGSCGSYWFGIEKRGGAAQANFTIDDIVVTDLGPSKSAPACAEIVVGQESPVKAGEAGVVTTTLRSSEKDEALGVRHSVSVPEGWAFALLESASDRLAPGGESVQRWLVSSPADARGAFPVSAVGEYLLGAQPRRVSGSGQVSVFKSALSDGVNFLSDVPFEGTPQNGWGPVERDQSNGEQAQNDGMPLRVGGVEFAKGIGAHANSSASFKLAGQCSVFEATVGVDDAQASRGSVRFRVLGDGKPLTEWTETLTATSDGVSLRADVSGVDVITLEADDAGDGNGNDWASWGDAKVTCSVDAQGAVPTLQSALRRVEAGQRFELSLAGFVGGADAQPVKLVDARSGQLLGTVELADGGAGTEMVIAPADFPAGELVIAAVQKVGDGWKLANVVVEVVAPEPRPGTDPGTQPGTEPSGEIPQSGPDTPQSTPDTAQSTPDTPQSTLDTAQSAQAEKPVVPNGQDILGKKPNPKSGTGGLLASTGTTALSLLLAAGLLGVAGVAGRRLRRTGEEHTE